MMKYLLSRVGHPNWQAISLLGLLATGCGSISPPQKPGDPEETDTGNPQVLRISQFSPAGGNVSTVPTTVAVTFNEGVTNIQGSNTTNYAMVCANSTLQFALSADVAFTVVTLTFPLITVSPGTLCSLIVAPGITNGAGTFLRGNRQADYLITGR